MEYWDIYTQDGICTGRKVKRGDAMAIGDYHLVIHLLILGKDGRLLLQKRSDQKESFPGYWDFGIGGSAVSGENARQCAQRELQEELGIHMDFQQRKPVLRSYGQHSLVDFFTIDYAGELADLTLQREEVSDVCWADLETVHLMCKQGIFIPYQPHLLALLLDMHKQQGLHCSS